MILPLDFYLAVAAFALVTSITPGPNNIMLTASGANFGFMRSMPHMLGIVLGIVFMNTAVGMGLGVIFETWPALQQILKIVGSAYLFWLAWQMLNFSTMSKTDGVAHGKPFTLLQGAIFQLVNPKAWVMVLSANASFSRANAEYWPSILGIVLVFIVVGYMSIMPWAAFGHAIRSLLIQPRFLRGFNIIMCLLTSLCVVFIWL